MPITGWKLDRDDRAALIERFPLEWQDVVADHVTLTAEAYDAAALPITVRAEIVGGINDGEGLQAMVVAIDGSTERPDGGTYHITWSLDCSRGRRASDSNAVIARLGWRPLDDPVPVRVCPAHWD